MKNFYKIISHDGFIYYLSMIDNHASKPLIISRSVNETEHLILGECYDLPAASTYPSDRTTVLSEKEFTTKFNDIVESAKKMAEPSTPNEYFIKSINKYVTIVSKILYIVDYNGKKIAKGISINSLGHLLILHKSGYMDGYTEESMINGIEDEELREYHKIDESEFIDSFNKWIKITQGFMS